MNFTYYTCLWVLFKRLCLTFSDEYLWLRSMKAALPTVPLPFNKLCYLQLTFGGLNEGRILFSFFILSNAKGICVNLCIMNTYILTSLEWEHDKIHSIAINMGIIYSTWYHFPHEMFVLPDNSMWDGNTNEIAPLYHEHKETEHIQAAIHTRLWGNE